MSLANVKCTSNSRALSLMADHIDGKPQPIRIEPGRASIDSRGVVRFFTLVYPDGDVQGYLLHPYSVTTVSPVAQGISWTLSFLGGYGLSRTRGVLTKVRPGTPPMKAEAIQLGSFFLFSTVGGHVLQGFVDDLFSKKDVRLGYHNVLTDKLVWPTPIRVGQQSA